jgi:hypothetical protein
MSSIAKTDVSLITLEGNSQLFFRETLTTFERSTLKSCLRCRSIAQAMLLLLYDSGTQPIAVHDFLTRMHYSNHCLQLHWSLYVPCENRSSKLAQRCCYWACWNSGSLLKASIKVFLRESRGTNLAWTKAESVWSKYSRGLHIQSVEEVCD